MDPYSDSSIEQKLISTHPIFHDSSPPVVTKEELSSIIRNIKQNKAPGYDYIDYKIIKRIFNVALQLVLTLYNTHSSTSITFQNPSK